jgi:hypothetical protein
MQGQQGSVVAPPASATTHGAPPAGATASDHSRQAVDPHAASRPPLPWTDSLTAMLASVVARRGSEGAPGAVLARKTTIRDNPSNLSHGIHAEFVGTPREHINPNIHYGPLLNECATSMNGWLMLDMDFQGSEPKPGTWPMWWSVGGNAPDFPDYWVRGHLLNANLGGPGEPRNLTPITKKCNAQHHALVEALCKHAFSQDQLVAYQVTARYNAVGPALAPTAKNPDRLVWPLLATQLECDWGFMDPNTQQIVGQGNTTIPNTH